MIVLVVMVIGMMNELRSNRLKRLVYAIFSLIVNVFFSFWMFKVIRRFYVVGSVMLPDQDYTG
jgi:hypothetical protein